MERFLSHQATSLSPKSQKTAGREPSLNRTLNNQDHVHQAVADFHM
jgi:hypothetical protein